MARRDMAAFAELSADPAVMEYLRPLAEPGAPKPTRRGCKPIGGNTDSGDGSSKSPTRQALSGWSGSGPSPLRRTLPRRWRSPGGWRVPIGAAAMPPRRQRRRSITASPNSGSPKLSRSPFRPIALAPGHGAARHGAPAARRFRSPERPRRPAEAARSLSPAEPRHRAVTILLVRHGETRWNLERRYQGRFDSPLTARGVAQAPRSVGCSRHRPKPPPPRSSPARRAGRGAPPKSSANSSARTEPC